MSTRKLQKIYNELRRRSLNPAAYDGELSDVSFEVCTADAFIAGIASTLLEGRVPDESHRTVLERHYVDGSEWLLGDGRRVNIRSSSEIHDHVRLLEQLRIECLRNLAD